MMRCGLCNREVEDRGDGLPADHQALGSDLWCPGGPQKNPAHLGGLRRYPMLTATNNPFLPDEEDEADMGWVYAPLLKEGGADPTRGKTFASPSLCGCGQPELALKTLRDLLRALRRNDDGDLPAWAEYRAALDALPREGLEYLVFYWMNEVFGWLEHGSAVPGWMTCDGEDLLAELEKLDLPEGA